MNRFPNVKASQILTVAKNRLETCFGRLPSARMAEVDRAIKLSLGL